MTNSRVDLGAFREAWGELTLIQQQTVELTCSGDTRAQIAETMYIQPSTVKNNLLGALQKLRPTMPGLDKQSGVMDVVCWAHGYQAALQALQDRMAAKSR